MFTVAWPKPAELLRIFFFFLVVVVIVVVAVYWLSLWTWTDVMSEDCPVSQIAVTCNIYTFICLQTAQGIFIRTFRTVLSIFFHIVWPGVHEWINYQILGWKSYANKTVHIWIRLELALTQHTKLQIQSSSLYRSFFACMEHGQQSKLQTLESTIIANVPVFVSLYYSP